MAAAAGIVPAIAAIAIKRRALVGVPRGEVPP